MTIDERVRDKRDTERERAREREGLIVRTTVPHRKQRNCQTDEYVRVFVVLRPSFVMQLMSGSGSFPATSVSSLGEPQALAASNSVQKVMVVTVGMESDSSESPTWAVCLSSL